MNDHNHTDLLDQLLDNNADHPSQPNYSSYTLNASEYLLSPDIPPSSLPKYLPHDSPSQKQDFHQSLGHPFLEDTARRLLNFDDAPITKSNFQVAEYEQTKEENVDKMSLGEKLAAKNVKIRLTAFDQLYSEIRSKNRSEFDRVAEGLAFEKLLK